MIRNCKIIDRIRRGFNSLLRKELEYIRGVPPRIQTAVNSLQGMELERIHRVFLRNLRNSIKLFRTRFATR